MKLSIPRPASESLAVGGNGDGVNRCVLYRDRRRNNRAIRFPIRRHCDIPEANMSVDSDTGNRLSIGKNSQLRRASCVMAEHPHCRVDFVTGQKPFGATDVGLPCLRDVAAQQFASVNQTRFVDGLENQLHVRQVGGRAGAARSLLRLPLVRLGNGSQRFRLTRLLIRPVSLVLNIAQQRRQSLVVNRQAQRSGQQQDRSDGDPLHMPGCPASRKL